MNTPLNDALPYGWVVEANDGHKTFFETDPAGFRHESYAGLATVHTLYTRTNTPESSAAQPALTGYDAEHAKFRMWLNKQTMPAMHDHAAIAWAGWEARCAQPSDATAQPRVDLTDEQIAKHLAEHGIGYIRLSKDATGHAEAFTGYDAEIYGNAIRSLLANTAQGKTCQKFRFNPEHTDHCDFCKCAKSDHALAAKKG